MIKTVRLDGVPAFTAASDTGTASVELGPLALVNFIYGPNGSGKSSIARTIAGAASSGGTPVLTWHAGPIATKVYDRKYVHETFEQVDEFPGVFVLGEESTDKLRRRTELSNERDVLSAALQAHRATLGTESVTGRGKLADRARALDNLQEIIWQAREAFQPELKFIFEGFNNSKQRLTSRVLELRAEKKPQVFGLPELASSARSLLDASATPLTVLAEPDLRSLEAYCSSDLWVKPIVGSDNSLVAQLISTIGNSDWVREGRAFLVSASGVCPFCQRPVPEDLAQHLVEYFDDSFTANAAQIETMAAGIEDELVALEELLSALDNLEAAYVDPKARDLVRANIGSTLLQTRTAVAKKRSALAEIVELPDIDAPVADLVEVVRNTNAKILVHNQLLVDRVAERTTLKSRTWDRFVWSDLDTALTHYESSLRLLDADVSDLEDRIAATSIRLQAVDEELRELAAGATTNQRAVDDINRMLAAAGFNRFRLEAAKNLKDGYRLVREDGSLVLDTWSEGEKSLVSFLYFLHEVRGFDPDNASRPECVVVIDDPISSLDSDTLFFVSTQVRELVREAVAATSNVRQLLVLTHNVYFHNEVTYKLGQPPLNLAAGDRTFHTIRKSMAGPHRIVAEPKNPISSTYALLWADVKNAMQSNTAPVGLQNTLRRILESYFKFTGDQTLNKVLEDLPEIDRPICRSMITWLHDGSHATAPFDELHFSPDATSSERQLQVFKKVFELAGHADHYRLMMGE